MRVDEPQVLPEDVLPVFVVIPVPVLLAVLALEGLERLVHVRGVRVHELLHGVEHVDAVAGVAGPGPAAAGAEAGVVVENGVGRFAD